ncbi:MULTISPECIES: D-glycero-beta-D-manno-heptose 1,7-bisphosphate 7-phosphatase [Aliivibrio]|uniref:D-glycero-beta-D-manno-heptose 1,7-bisphosphate 7-phosphatase n=1 Tax=Aliivibrio TaxID=511678 RepID=UPI0006CF87BB|nr:MULTISPECIES: D-glycero-beta-D-manno-heptose 1,7-bisphosphate 7-phosphatase [Aliivibrio]MBD1568351.1 D-glycero-beta-D-manno-heptose 1,7-bisphosphate 7-phosphatase [Aliivibrio sp. S10_S31]MUH98570.1 D-glycero-beta-D-manno-heptose 1,7-bisphosphate 7-phosphatase [Aliivibrio fischeri]MUI62197.1 D-glycero-beta-D-manno-heptose 1,7-bisphosphate 7-phosphatase [Aliivibrio fischeri]MUL11426.1 D-glycero-beta-D-manno-heptose 1,7-bisphosphate 7-phosphatase [Aliivibrio fischeri]MUL11938.1 D-glycero-beta-
MSKPAVFIDRDGVINVDRGYVHKRDDFEYIDGVFEATKKLKEMGYLLVLVTNQSGIARGMFTEDQFEILTEWMDWNFADNGVDFDGIYYCPHHPEATVEKYKEACDCRKPNPGMLVSAQRFLDIDMENSIMIGDKKEDMMAAQAAGVGTRILVRTGKPVTEEGEALATTVLDSVADVPKFLSA